MAKAKALARSWRMVRRLSPTDRRFLAKEAGFDGAEDLLESLAAKRSGVAPALMLQFLSGFRDRGDEGLGTVMACLRDPKTREDMLMRSADAVAEAFGEEEPEGEETLDDEPAPPTDDTTGEPAPETGPRTIEDEAFAQGVFEPVEINDGGADNDSAAPARIPAIVEDQLEKAPITKPTEPMAPAQIEAERPPVLGTTDVGLLVEAIEAETSLAARLLSLRRALPGLGGTGAAALSRLVQTFPEGWPQRRALTALLEAGLPDDAGEALDLIEGLERPVNRRWCLGVLAARSDLLGADFDRALVMAESPAVRRRIQRESGRH